jgi:acyl-CoA thioester hydrolase
MSDGPTYSHFIDVDDRVIDANGHVNNVAFVQWMQDAAVAHSDAVGGTEMTKRLNLTWVVRRHTIEYRLPVYKGERIEVRTTVVDCRRVSSRRKYEFVRDEKVVARGETDWVLIDLGTLGPVQIPGEMMRLWGATPDRE